MLTSVPVPHIIPSEQDHSLYFKLKGNDILMDNAVSDAGHIFIYITDGQMKSKKSKDITCICVPMQAMSFCINTDF
ncbi:hypothetical protein D4758_03395 [Enterocloster citroniae]|nr:hypothetical protein [Enterocloster citroniae]